VLWVATELVEQDAPQPTFLEVPATETRLRLSIRDTGKGIRADDLPHVFDPFFTTKSSGTGLGLSVSHGIIQEHQAVIDVESQRAWAPCSTSPSPCCKPRWWHDHRNHPAPAHQP
jgi:signal transduction histidine kinase